MQAVTTIGLDIADVEAFRCLSRKSWTEMLTPDIGTAKALKL